MIKRPNAERHNPDHEYVQGLFLRLSQLGRTKRSVCEQLGVPTRTMADYTNPNCPTKIDYCTQYALEQVLAFEEEVASC